jgi:hypothetical protein
LVSKRVQFIAPRSQVCAQVGRINAYKHGVNAGMVVVGLRTLAGLAGGKFYSTATDGWQFK